MNNAIPSLRARSQQGFTLLEVMLAMAIFAALSVLAWQLLHGASLFTRRTEQLSERASQSARLYQLLQRDLWQAVITDPTVGALTQDKQQHLTYHTRQSFAELRGLPVDALQRVSWWVEEGALQRETRWRDADGALVVSRYPVLAGVQGAEWEIYDRRWQKQWQQDSQPALVALTLRLANGSRWRWVFDTPLAGAQQLYQLGTKVDERPQTPAAGDTVNEGG